jgi:CubicO group peptidase (beta-lactamase class C family)
MTATALARLVDTERIALDTGIARYVPSLPNRVWAPLTPRQLASHTAGIVDYATNRDLPGLWRSIRETRRYQTATAALDVFDGSGLRYRPGTRFLYSSFDVNLLGAVMESITGTRYPALMDSLVFAPIGARSLHAQGAADSSAHATFYEVRAGRWRAWRRVDHTYKWPSGGLVGTPSDVARVGGAWFDTTFVKPATATEFWTPQQLVDGRVNEQAYAIGWRVNRQPRLTIAGCPALQVHHGGVSKGSFSWLVLYPERRLAVSLMTNAQARTFREFASVELELTRLILTALEQRTAPTMWPGATCTRPAAPSSPHPPGD